jgi:GntR family transcriptional regulator, transcriptional repressor for pyruvate dehydrogenase complex
MPDLPDLSFEQREAASQALAGALRRRIMLGGFTFGSKLPTERDLALGLGVSRNTVRQAMRILAAEGLISTSRGRNGGSMVELPAVPPRSRREIAAAWRQSIDDAYRFRLATEPLAARWAAERSTAEQRAELARLAGQDSAGLPGYHQLDARFHLLVAEMAGHDLLLESITRAREEMFREVNTLWMFFGPDGDGGAGQLAGPGAFEGFAGEHTPIVRAIGNGDAERASAAMAAHLQQAREQFARLLEEILASGRATAMSQR